jgi:hypothetical protein
MIITKPATKDYLDNYDRIFKKDSVKVAETNLKESQNAKQKRKTKSQRK